MSNTSPTDRAPLQRIGENAAYTAKGLFKTADWYEGLHRLLTLVPIAMCVSALAFPGMPDGVLRTIAVLALVASFALLYFQRDMGNVRAYRGLSNDFLRVVDQARFAWDEGDAAAGARLQQELDKLRGKTEDLPVSPVGRIWSKRAIDSEMDLDWTKREMGDTSTIDLRGTGREPS